MTHESEYAKSQGISVGRLRLSIAFTQAVDRIGKHKPELKQAILDGRTGLTLRQVILMAHVEYSK